MNTAGFLSRRDSAHGQRGFTLLELIITLSLATLIFAIATTAYEKASKGSQLKVTARNIAVCLNAARNEAITLGRPATFSINLVNRSFQYSGTNKTFPIQDHIDIKVYAAASATARNGISTIYFAPDGSSSGGRVELGSGSHRLVISVDWLTGKVAIDA